MNRKIFSFLPVLIGLFAASCSRAPSEELLLLYTRSHGIYREGRFAETAKLLSGQNDFVPALLLRGKAEYFCGELKKAESSFKRVLELKKNDAEASLFLARVFRESGRQGEAQKITENSLGNNPMDIRTLRFAAELASERGASGETAALLDRAVEASAESALVFLDRARLKWSRGNGSGALEDLRRARVLLPEDSPVLKAVEKLQSLISEVSP